MKKLTKKILLLSIGFLGTNLAFAEQTVDIEVRGIKGERAIENTNLNVNLIAKEEMDGSDRYKMLVTQAIDRGLRVFGYYDSKVVFKLKTRTGKRDLLIANVNVGEPTKIAGTDVKIEIGRASCRERV